MELPMSTSAVVHAVTDRSFATEVAPGTGLVAVEFSAEWCPPCHMMAPIVEAAATEFATIRFLCMDTDADPATMVRYGVLGLPTMLLFRDGELVDRIVGAMPKAALLDRLARHTSREVKPAAVVSAA
jgi:thioredoxin 1